jgi:mono/diheme cytochrome c family protein
MLQASRSFRSFTTALTLAVPLLCGAVALCNAAEQPDGATLYQKHCASCHPDGSKLKLDVPLHNSLRTPPLGMPSFGQEKLSDRDVQAIGTYLRPGVSAAPPKEPAPQAPAGPSKPSKEKKSWMKGFGTSDL